MRLYVPIFLAGLILFTNQPRALCVSAEDVLAAIPVQHGGRVKPFLSFARESTLQVIGRTSFEGKKAVELVWEWAASYSIWESKPILPVTYPDLRKLFSDDLVKNRISPQAALSNMDFLKSVQEAQQKQEKKETLNRLEKKELELYGKARLFQEIGTGNMPGLVPHPENPQASWLPPAAFLSDEGKKVLLEFYEKGAVEHTSEVFGYLMKRIQENEFRMAAPSAASFAEALSGMLKTRDIFLDEKTVKLEIFYWKLRPFHLAWILYLAGVLFPLTLTLSPKGRGKGEGFNVPIGLLAAGFLFHTAGFLLRILIAGRPPVTNMYESIIWVSWGVVLFSWGLWLFYRASPVLKVAALVSSFALVIGENLPAVLDASINPLVPVLRSNYWLTVHVLTITLGYGAFALNWGISHALLYRLSFTPVKKTEIKDLTEYLYRSQQIGLILLSAGTVLGGVWASYSWGRFWGWDPKETWALIAILTYLAVLHGRIAGWLDQFQTAFWSAFAFLTVVMAWYGVNFVLGVGLHSYGFGGGGLNYVLGVVACDVIFLLFFSRKFKMRTHHG